MHGGFAVIITIQSLVPPLDCPSLKSSFIHEALRSAAPASLLMRCCRIGYSCLVCGRAYLAVPAVQSRWLAGDQWGPLWGCSILSSSNERLVYDLPQESSETCQVLNYLHNIALLSSKGAHITTYYLTMFFFCLSLSITHRFAGKQGCCGNPFSLPQLRYLRG